MRLHCATARRHAMTLIEVLISAALGTLLLMVVLELSIFGAHSFAAMTNVVDLDQYNRNAVDRMIAEIRQADRLTQFATNNLVFQIRDADTGATNTLRYSYDSARQILTRTLNEESLVYLTGCTFMRFSIFQRNPVSGAYDQYPVPDPSRPDLCKLVQLDWGCARSVPSQSITNQSVQTVKVVMRKP